MDAPYVRMSLLAYRPSDDLLVVLLGGAQDHYGLVVEVGRSGLKIVDGLEYGVHCELRSRGMLRFEELSEAFVAEHLIGGVDGIYDAVGEEDDEIARAGGEGKLLILCVGEEAKGEAFSLNGADAWGFCDV